MESTKTKKQPPLVVEDTLTIEETFVTVYNFAIKKAASPLLATFLMGITSGVFIGIAYIGSIHTTSGWKETSPIGLKYLIYGVVFTVAIVMIIFIGGELFTSNSMMFLPTIQKKIKVSRFIANLLIVLIGNFIGCTFLAYLTELAGFLDIKPFLDNIKGIYNKKMNLSWLNALASGFLCNILVSGSVYISHATRSSTGKFFLVFILIMVFAATGLSHVVANCYLWLIGPLLSWHDDKIATDFLKFGYQIQLPTIVGNFLSGGVCLPLIYYFIFNCGKTKNNITL